MSNIMLKSVIYARELTYLAHGMSFKLLSYTVILMFVDFLKTQYAIGEGS